MAPRSSRAASGSIAVGAGQKQKGEWDLGKRREMSDKTYEDREYWNRLRKSRDYYEEEHVTLDGRAGEIEFDDRIQEAVEGRDVLDVGCGVGLFTIEIARRAKKVVGVDFSKEALARARRNRVVAEWKNLRFEWADAGNLPFAEAEFDIVVSRRGPVTSSAKTVSEAYRVLRRNGLLMEITIGERDKENLLRIFGRGQMYGVKEAVAVSKKRMLEKTGFKEIEIVDYVATEVFEGMKDLIVRLKSAPIIPDFDVERDKPFLTIVEKTYATPRGIETPVHRVTMVAKK